MRVLITGGHFSPALSVIEVLKKRNIDVVVVGRKYALEGDLAHSFEYEVCKERKIPFISLSTGRIQRKITKHTLFSLFSIPKGFFQAMRILGVHRPDVILTFGSYVSYPIACAAFLRRIPIVIHEQTQHAGFSNKLIAKIANKVCISFESSKRYFPQQKVVLTGNPLRSEIFHVNEKITISGTKKLLYITGGSTGSHAINTFIRSILHDLLQKYCVIHQTGDAKEFSDYEHLEELRKKLPQDHKERYVIKKFVFPSQIGWILKNADIIVARSGINTISELIALKKKCLLIPLPYGQINEQLENAKLAKSLKLGDYIEQHSLTSEHFFNTIDKVLGMKVVDEQTIKSWYFPDAADKIADVVQLIYESST